LFIERYFFFDSYSLFIELIFTLAQKGPEKGKLNSDEKALGLRTLGITRTWASRTNDLTSWTLDRDVPARLRTLSGLRGLRLRDRMALQGTKFQGHRPRLGTLGVALQTETLLGPG
jgi:hypothetical protein